MIKLYHGTIYDFNKIDIKKGRGYKDFGRGFYATSVPEHADRIARRNKQIELQRVNHLKSVRNESEDVVIKAYRYNLIFDDNLAQHLRIRRFDHSDSEWLKFIMMNRHSRETVHTYDIVIGPTADARTSMILNAYREELIQSNYDENLCNKVIDKLMPENLPWQYFFGTDDAIETLMFDTVRREVIG